MTTLTKLDLKKTLKHLYNPPSQDFTLVEVPPLNYLMIDGQGDPNLPAFGAAAQALYSLAYPLKFLSKNTLGLDYTVMPLEGLWWADDVTVFTQSSDRTTWRWTAMILQPDHITPEMVEHIRAEMIKKKGSGLLPNVRFETYHEGLSVQIMYFGPYAAEAPTLARLHNEYIPNNNLAEAGNHHEIYLSDPARTAPEKMKTVLRQPVRHS